MALPTTITDAHFGTSEGAGVTPDGGLCVVNVLPSVPRQHTVNRARFYHSLLGSTGADSGTTNQNTDAGTYYIESHEDYDIHIMRVVIVIADTAALHNRFGNITVLSSGWDLFVTESGEDTFLIEKAQTGGQVIAQSGFVDGYGDGAASWRLLNWTGTEDAQTIAMPVSDWVPDGIRIGRGTRDRITSTFTDDLTGLTEFTVRVLGYRLYP